MSVTVLAAIEVMAQDRKTSCGNRCMKDSVATVYLTKKITPEALVSIYKAMGVKARGRVAIKISTGESSRTNHLRPDFIKPLVDEVHGTLVECNTAYGGARSTTESHRKAIAERGYDKIARVDIMDADGSMELPVRDTTWIKYDLVGSPEELRLHD